MTSYRRRLSYLTACLIAVSAAPAQMQIPPAGPRAPEPVVTGAPYTADSVVTVKLTAFGDPVTQRVVARVYRDSAGRVRREQTVMGQETPRSSEPADLVVTIVDPVAGIIYSLNPATRTAHRLVIPVTGQKTVSTLPAGTDGRPVEISDERWESRDLRVVVLASHRDSRTGEFEHRLTNISRVEPSAQLFTLPANYTIVDAIVPASR
ncbi:MAG TPA: hypothetical protein VES67_07510 [Vicinamibacterales bacterium]|nr:hypothetical protein [Vicinamibacterales bacterium]